MSATSSADLRDYVRAAAQLLALPLDDERVGRVALHLARTQALAAQLQAFALAPEDEPAEIYCPAPFPGDSSDDS